MKKNKLSLGAVALAMIIVAAVLLTSSRLRQHLGDPGVKTRPLPGGKMEILLPETVSGYRSEISTEAEATLLKALPPDTSYCVRLYHAESDPFFSLISVVLMGTDRGSIHRPEVCMVSQGWEIDGTSSKMETIAMDQPFKYTLPVQKIVCSKSITNAQGQQRTVHGIFLFWFVDATHLTANQFQWMLWWMPRDLILHGKLERWAYISYFSPCLPGEENATFNRMKALIALSVPQFQLMPRASQPAD